MMVLSEQNSALSSSVSSAEPCRIRSAYSTTKESRTNKCVRLFQGIGGNFQVRQGLLYSKSVDHLSPFVSDTLSTTREFPDTLVNRRTILSTLEYVRFLRQDHESSDISECTGLAHCIY